MTVTAEAEGRLRYGPVRAVGLGGLHRAVVARRAELLERQGEPVILWLLIGLAVAIALASWLLLPDRLECARTSTSPLRDSPRPPPRPGLAGLRRNGGDRGSLLHAGHAVLYAFGTQHWLSPRPRRRHGGSSVGRGACWPRSSCSPSRPRLDGWLSPRGHVADRRRRGPWSAGACWRPPWPSPGSCSGRPCTP